MRFSERAKKATIKVADIVREAFSAPPARGLSTEQAALGIHLRGNGPLHEALKALIRTRIEGRANLPEPSDPLVAKSMLARDRELQWLLSELDYLFNSPVSQPADDDMEPPA